MPSVYPGSNLAAAGPFMQQSLSKLLIQLVAELPVFFMS